MFPADILMSAELKAELAAVFDKFDDRFLAAMPHIQGNPKMAEALVREGYRMLLGRHRYEVVSKRKAPAFKQPKPLHVRPSDKAKSRERLASYGFKFSDQPANAAKPDDASA